MDKTNTAAYTATVRTVGIRIAAYVRGQGEVQGITVDQLCDGMSATEQERKMVPRVLAQHRDALHSFLTMDRYERPTYKDGLFSAKRLKPT